jgi:hypothetical protein
MSYDAWIAKCVERLTNASQLDDAEFLRAWSCCVNGGLVTEVVDAGSVLSVESMERMAAMVVDYRSPRCIGSAIGITNVFEAELKRALIHPYDIERVLDGCSGKNIALAGELVRQILHRMPQLIPLASQQLISLANQTLVLPADRSPDEISLRGMAYLTLAQGGTQYAFSLIDADTAQQECIETLWKWRVGSLTPWKLYRYEDEVTEMMAEIRRHKAGE